MHYLDATDAPQEETRFFVVYDSDGLITQEITAAYDDEFAAIAFAGKNYTEVDQFPNPDYYYIDNDEVTFRGQMQGGATINSTYKVGDVVEGTNMEEGTVIEVKKNNGIDYVYADEFGVAQYTFTEEGTHIFEAQSGASIRQTQTCTVGPNTAQEIATTAQMILDEESHRIAASNWALLSDSNLHPSDVTAWRNYRAEVRLVKQQYNGEPDYGIVQWPDPSTLAGYPSGY